MKRWKMKKNRQSLYCDKKIRLPLQMDVLAWKSSGLSLGYRRVENEFEKFLVHVESGNSDGGNK